MLMTTHKVLFLCPHHAAKSVLAMVYFNQRVQALGLDYRADSAGTEPDAAVMPVVATMLATEGVDVSGHVPRHVTREDFASSLHIISMGCSAEELGLSAEKMTLWEDVPPVSQNPEHARTAIHTYVDALISELSTPE
jgi:protein-tyrosine-phosphatase